jgi:hypothetical protein
VNACQPLDTAGETYVVTADITVLEPDGTCFPVLADRITVDLGGHTLTGPSTTLSKGISDDAVARTSTVVKNGTIQRFGRAIDLVGAKGHRAQRDGVGQSV